jgi:hypothetical protein
VLKGWFWGGDLQSSTPLCDTFVRSRIHRLTTIQNPFQLQTHQQQIFQQHPNQQPTYQQQQYPNMQQYPTPNMQRVNSFVGAGLPATPAPRRNQVPYNDTNSSCSIDFLNGLDAHDGLDTLPYLDTLLNLENLENLFCGSL